MEMISVNQYIKVWGFLLDWLSWSVQSSLCAAKLFIMVRLNPLSAALASLLPFVAAHPFDLWTRDDFRGECGTVTTAEDLAAIAAVAGQGSSSFSSVSAKGFSAA